MTPNVLDCVRKYGIDPVAVGPWIDLEYPAPTATWAPALLDLKLPFKKFAACYRIPGNTALGDSPNAVGEPYGITVQDLRDDPAGPRMVWEVTVGLRYGFSKVAQRGLLRYVVHINAGDEPGSDRYVVTGSTPKIAEMARYGFGSNCYKEVRALLGRVHAAFSTYAPAHKVVQLQRRPPNARGKSTGYEWRAIEIAPPSLPSTPLGGHHASPRAHDRRGHWVTRNGKRFWRRSCRVGDASDGFVFHTYTAPATATP
jgi:hypothetical protein